MLSGIYFIRFPYWLNWLFYTGIGLSLMFFFNSLFHFFDKRPAIIINEIGIANRRNKYGMLNWAIIKEAYVYSGGSDVSGIIYFKVFWQYNPELKMSKWKRKLVHFNSDLGHEVLKLVIDDVDVDPQKLLLFIKRIIKLNQTEIYERQKMIKNW
jgi:hypothetical protein